MLKSVLTRFCAASRRLACTAILTCVAGPALWSAEPPPSPVRHPTRILARYRDASPGATAASASALTNVGVQVSRQVGLVPGLVILDDVSMVRAASVSATTPTLDQRIAALRRTGLFSYVEPDYEVSISALPTDLRFTDGTLWGLRNTGQNGGTAGVDIDAARAWQITTGSRDVIVAVVDTGIDYTHTELRDQMWRNPGEIPENGLDDDGDGVVDDVFGINAIDPDQPPLDDHNHGTHVAGTIGAAANDGFPHVGVAWQVRLMACKFLSAQGSGYTSDAVTCIDYATRHGASIINASWGGGEYTQALVDSIAAAGEAGVLFVAAAGNSGLDLQSELGERYPAYPAGYNLDTILSVAAIDRRGSLASFSNFGRFSVDVGAPGDEIFSSLARFGKAGYGTFRGTSMAAPHAAGAAALARARYPDLTARELKALLVRTATPTASLIDRTVSGGRINAYAAVSNTSDGQLELSMGLPDTHIAYSGHPLRITAYVTDLHERPGATVVGEADGVFLVFRDDGVAPDERAGDAIYSAWVIPSDDVDTLTVTARAELQGFTAATSTFTIPAKSPPANDTIARAAVIPGAMSSIRASNEGASLEPGEPTHDDFKGGASVWWRWTAPDDSDARVVVSQTFLDPIVAVYAVGDSNELTLIAESVERGQYSNETALSFAAHTDVTYLIAVDAWDGAFGDFCLDFISGDQPSNDAFDHPATLAGTVIEFIGSTLGGTNEPGESSSRGVDGSAVWYTWTAPLSGMASLGIESKSWGNHACEVYTGTTIGGLVPETNYTATVLGTALDRYQFRALAGQTYHIAVRSVGEPIGYFTLFLRDDASPPNDAFADRIPLAGDDLAVAVDNRGATPEAGEPTLWDPSLDFFLPSASVWYTWTAPRDGTAWVRIPFDGFFSTLAAYTGDHLESLTPVARGYQNYVILFTPFYGNHMTFPVCAGETYTIMVGGVEGTTAVTTMHITTLTPPPNMRPADALPITGASAQVIGSSMGATDSLWWTWTAPSAGAVAVNVSSTDFRPIVQVSKRLNDGPPVPIEQPVFDSTRVVFEAAQGTTYLFRIDADPSGRNLPGLTGADAMHGAFRLSLVLDPRPQDSPARASTLVGEAVTTRASNQASASQRYDYELGTDSLYAPVWWSWTAPTSGTCVISTAGTDLDTVLGVFSSNASRPVTLLALNDDAKPGRLQSEVRLTVQAGATYHILVDTRGGTGTVTLSVRRLDSPGNDAFSRRTYLDAANPVAGASTVDATAEPSEPHHAFIEPEHSVWWTWTASESGLYIASTAGSTFDTIVGVYTGDSIDSLHWISGNDDGPGPDQTSLAVFRAIAGVSYQIAVDGYSGATGNVALSVLPFDRPSISVLVPFRPMPPGEPLRLVADVRGRGPYSFQWYRNGVAIPGATDMSLTIPLLQQFHAGAYTLVITSPSGPTTAGPFSIEVADPGPSTASVVNLSTRALCRGGDDVLIPGFVISGAGTRRILMRAIGPELAALGVGHPLADPSFVVMRREMQGHVEIDRNDDWADDTAAATIDSVTQQVHAFPLDTTSASSALVMDLPAGAYTVIAQGRPGQSGIALVELYDAGSGIASPGDTARVINLSNRGYAADGEDVMIPGFVVEGSGTRTFLLRAVGPGLTSLGLNGALPDPSLLVFRHDDASAQLILQNDSWGENGEAADVAAIAMSLGAFALEPGSLDAAMVVTLPPGVYTAHARGVPGTSGVVLVELYLVP